MHGFRVQDLLPLCKWFKSVKCSLESVHHFHVGTRSLSALLQRPGLMDDLNDVFTKLFLELAAGWFSIATRVAIKHSHGCRFLRDDFCQVGIALADVHQNQRHNQPIENHHSLLHCAAEARIGIMNAQHWQDAAEDNTQPDSPKKTQEPDDDRPSNEQRSVEKKFKHG